jgi:YVTN family beta-propeller protein
VASIDLTNDKLLSLLDVGKTPTSLTLKPDGGELMVCNFDSDNASIIETTTNEVGGTYLIGTHPAQGLVTRDNSRLYVSNFGSNSVAVYDIDAGKVISTLPVGAGPRAMAFAQSEDYILVLDTQSGDVAVIQRRPPTKRQAEYSLFTIVPTGTQPNQIAVKAFMLRKVKQ